MAGEWIKVEIGLPEKPEVMRLARLLNKNRFEIVGTLFRFWIWVDKNTVDGVVDGVEASDVDEIVSMPGFGLAMKGVGWLEVDPDNHRIIVPKFDRHNGESAKKRALKNERQARWRSQQPSTDESTKASTSKSTRASTREEKRRSTPVIPVLFDKFYQAYPRKVAKPKALAAWVKLNPDVELTDRILEAIERARPTEQWRKEKGKFIPHPATWLNERRFEDELPEPEQKRFVV